MNRRTLASRSPAAQRRFMRYASTFARQVELKISGILTLFCCWTGQNCAEPQKRKARQAGVNPGNCFCRFTGRYVGINERCWTLVLWWAVGLVRNRTLICSTTCAGFCRLQKWANITLSNKPPLGNEHPGDDIAKARYLAESRNAMTDAQWK